MRIVVPILITLLFFAVPASAGQVQVLDHQIIWLNSCDDYAHYQWRANIQNHVTCPKKINLKINLYDEDGYIIDTVYHSVYLQGGQREVICGSTNFKGDASRVKTSTAEILQTHPISR